jgi:hypothetical protein
MYRGQAGIRHDGGEGEDLLPGEATKGRQGKRKKEREEKMMIELLISRVGLALHGLGLSMW